MILNMLMVIVKIEIIDNSYSLTHNFKYRVGQAKTHRFILHAFFFKRIPINFSSSTSSEGVMVDS